jgi:hypothetical protein
MIEEDDRDDELFQLRADLKYYREKWQNCHEKWGDALRLNYGYAVRITELQKALADIVNCKIFAWRFDHSGAMNATQLSERDLFLKLWGQAKQILSKSQSVNA